MFRNILLVIYKCPGQVLGTHLFLINISQLFGNYLVTRLLWLRFFWALANLEEKIEESFSDEQLNVSVKMQNLSKYFKRASSSENSDKSVGSAVKKMSKTCPKKSKIIKESNDKKNISNSVYYF